MKLPVLQLWEEPALPSANLHCKVDFHVLVLLAAKCTLRLFWNQAPFRAVLKMLQIVLGAEMVLWSSLYEGR